MLNIAEVVITVGTIFSALAACVIAFYARANYEFIEEIQKQDGRFREILKEQAQNHHQEVKDLYKAIVISQLLSNRTNEAVVKDAIKIFKKTYDGKNHNFF